MKKKLIIFLPVLLLISIIYLTLIKKSDEYPSGASQEKQPNEWFFMQRAFPQGEINHKIYLKSLKQSRQFRKQQLIKKDSSVWEFAGPTNIGGRITDVEMYPTNMEIIYIGAASGGVFKTMDAGNSWISIFDDALSLSIGDIALAPSDPDVIYVGTGEANAGGGSLAYDGIGIYKSTDAGNTWNYLGLEESRNIGRMVVHPDNPDILYVAAMGNLFANTPERGIYKTSNGGQTWENVLFVSDSTGGIDIVIHPTNPDTLYAAMWERIRRPNRRSYGGWTCGIYVTYNEGHTWTELTNGLPSPGNNIGRIGIDISKSEPNILYAIYADKTGYFEGVYKTTNGGNTWTQTNDGSLTNCYVSYGWWFGRISVDPVDPEIAYVIGLDLYKTSNGGNSWSNISSLDVHVDQHGLYAHPENNNFVFLGNDGGLYISQNGGNSWTWINNLPITQFYTCEVDNQYPYRLYGGTQDNGTNRTMAGGTDDWENIYWGDGFYVLVDPENNNYVYAEYQYGNFARSTNGGSSFSAAMNGISSSDRKNWNTPVVFDPSNPEILYYGANRLYKSTNHAGLWSAISTDLSNGPGGGNLTYGTITTISVSPVNPEIIYVGTDDGNVWVGDDNGTEWEYISSALPVRWVTRVAADPFEENTAYVTFSGYRYDEFLPHIFKTTDKGQNWEDISGNLPEAPINDIIPDSENDSTLYIATDVGVFVTRNSGEIWEMLGTNLPNVPVCDLTIHNGTRKLIAATYGRSMYTYDLYQDTISTSTNPLNAGIDRGSLNIFPNPFFISTKIAFVCQKPENGRIEIFDITGRKVKTLYIGKFNPGLNEFIWKPENNTQRINEGIYIINVIVGDKIISEKVICRKT
ncbi:MAG: T9SS type A sorting domain-containing protein [Bacteroidetes bacterium]|nr:T9SS type A sorting domain-containing protein [Bacteroidota bacterium]MBL7105252.1 T9SS type A sorting domain-containing protein [Bacteroidales bacterium]